MKGYITNEWDRDNLQFLLSCGTDELSDWYAQCDEDDKVYAQELLDAYSRELKLHSEELLIESQMQSFDDATRVLKKFVL